MGDDRAIQIANACTRKLIERQGPNGEWPWFFDAASGRVLDFYEVYSVHQYGMAPAFLGHAEQHGVFEARSAIVRGFNWVLGQNLTRQTHARARLTSEHSVTSAERRAAHQELESLCGLFETQCSVLKLPWWIRLRLHFDLNVAVTSWGGSCGPSAPVLTFRN